MLLSVAPLAGLPNVVIDPNILPAGNHPVVVGYVANRSATLLAYGVSSAGSDWTDWHLRDLASGQDLPDVLRHTKYYRPVFTPDGRGLYYSAFPPPQGGRGTERGGPAQRHLLPRAGFTTARSDRRILGDGAHPDWQYEPFLSEDGRWLIVRAGEGEVGDKAVEDLYLVDTGAAAPAPRGGHAGLRRGLRIRRYRCGPSILSHLAERAQRARGRDRPAAPGTSQLEERDRRGRAMPSIWATAA